MLKSELNHGPGYIILCRSEAEAQGLLYQLSEILEEWVSGGSELILKQTEDSAELFEGWGRGMLRVLPLSVSVGFGIVASHGLFFFPLEIEPQDTSLCWETLVAYSMRHNLYYWIPWHREGIVTLGKPVRTLLIEGQEGEVMFADEFAQLAASTRCDLRRYKKRDSES